MLSFLNLWQFPVPVVAVKVRRDLLVLVSVENFKGFYFAVIMTLVVAVFVAVVVVYIDCQRRRLVFSMSVVDPPEQNLRLSLCFTNDVDVVTVLIEAEILLRGTVSEVDLEPVVTAVEFYLITCFIDDFRPE